MPGRIPQEFIDDLIDRADIIEVIGSRIQLKKAGREHKACCPFHNEKTPSFTVSADKGFYHCFGCGAHGTALGFLMEHDHLEFVDAVEELASLYGMEVPRAESPGAPAPPSAPLYELLGEVAQFFRQCLREHPRAIDYLKARGLDGETAKRYLIGYAPGGWDTVLKKFGGSDERHKRLLKAGLILENEQSRSYDRFRDRIVFPIRDSRGRVVGFGGRIIDDGEPKYLNSPETPVFHKGRELYGLFEMRQALRQLERVLVVEGYMDVVALAHHGILNAVATLGTATTADHLRRLFRTTQEVVFCFDGDRAGRDAAWRALQVGLAEMRDGRQLRFLFLPDGQDPDSLVQSEGAEGLRQRLSESVALSEYLLTELTAQTDMSTVDGRARLAELARPLLGRLPEGVYRELLFDRIAAEVGLTTARLVDTLRLSDAAGASVVRRPAVTGKRSGLVRHAIRLVLHYPSVATEIQPPAELKDAEQPGVALLLELLELARGRPDINTAVLEERLRDRPEARHLTTLLGQEMLVDRDEAAAELTGSLVGIQRQVQEQRLESLIARADQLSATEKQEFLRLQQNLAGKGDLT
jgi:DNA primase